MRPKLKALMLSAAVPDCIGQKCGWVVVVARRTVTEVIAPSHNDPDLIWRDPLWPGCKLYSQNTQPDMSATPKGVMTKLGVRGFEGWRGIWRIFLEGNNAIEEDTPSYVRVTLLILRIEMGLRHIDVFAENRSAAIDSLCS